MKSTNFTSKAGLTLILLLFAFSGCRSDQRSMLNESICVESDGKCFQIIKKGAKLPISFSETYSNAEDNQTRVSIGVYQGESKEMDSNRLVGTYDFSLTQPNETGKEQIQVTIVIEDSKKFNLTIKDLKTEKQQEFFGGIVN